MSMYGKSFIFNGTPSELFDLRIISDFGVSSPVSSPAGGDVTIKEDWIYRREVPYFYGRYYQSSLEFDITVGSYSAIDGATRHAIETWLLGKNTYLPLRIVQDDISHITYNVIFTKSNNIYAGNFNYALGLHVKCDLPWGLYYPADTIITWADGPIANYTFDYYNGSSYSGYNRPTLTFTMGTYGDYFSLINTTDNDREFRFDGLTTGEIITVDNDHQIITSSLGNLRMANFNKNFFRLIQGTNSLSISGYITELTISAVFPRGVGV